MYQVHIGDAAKYLDDSNLIPSNGIQVIFTSPNPPITMSERLALFNNLVKCKRVMTDTGTLFLQLGDYYDNNGSMMGLPESMLVMLKPHFLIRSKLVWNRTERYKQLDRNRFRVDTEYIYMLTKSTNHYFNDKLGLQDSSLIQAQIENIKPGEFKSGFPERLVEICIKVASHAGDFVMDPFAGTCTTGVVALKNKRHFIGIESREDTQDMIKTRLDKFDFCACDVDKQKD